MRTELGDCIFLVNRWWAKTESSWTESRRCPASFENFMPLGRCFDLQYVRSAIRGVR